MNSDLYICPRAKGCKSTKCGHRGEHLKEIYDKEHALSYCNHVAHCPDCQLVEKR